MPHACHIWLLAVSTEGLSPPSALLARRGVALVAALPPSPLCVPCALWALAPTSVGGDPEAQTRLGAS